MNFNIVMKCSDLKKIKTKVKEKLIHRQCEHFRHSTELSDKYAQLKGFASQIL